MRDNKGDQFSVRDTQNDPMAEAFLFGIDRVMYGKHQDPKNVFLKMVLDEAEKALPECHQEDALCWLAADGDIVKASNMSYNQTTVIDLLFEKAIMDSLESKYDVSDLEREVNDWEIRRKSDGQVIFRYDTESGILEAPKDFHQRCMPTRQEIGMIFDVLAPVQAYINERLNTGYLGLRWQTLPDYKKPEDNEERTAIFQEVFKNITIGEVFGLFFNQIKTLQPHAQFGCYMDY